MANPFSKDCGNRHNEGNIRRLRLGYSADLWQNGSLENEVENDAPASFLFFENWIVDWSNEDAMIRSFEINDTIDEHGRKPTVGFMVRMPEDVLPKDFRNWWWNVKRRHLVAETTNWNKVVRVINPLMIDYKYVQADNYDGEAYYEFSLLPTRAVSYNNGNNSLGGAIVGVTPECHELIDAIGSTPVSCEVINLRTIVSCQI